MVEAEQFLIQSPPPDWIRRRIFLSDLRDSAVNLILKEGDTSQTVQWNQLPLHHIPPLLDGRVLSSKISSWHNGLFSLSFSRSVFADHWGVEYASKTGYDATQLGSIFETLERMNPGLSGRLVSQTKNWKRWPCSTGRIWMRSFQRIPWSRW